MINSNAICSTFCTPFKIHTKIHIEFCESYRPFEEYSVRPNLYLPLAAQLHTQSTLFSTRAHALRGVLLLLVTLNRRPRCLTSNALLPSNLVPVFHRIRHPFRVEIGTRFSPKMIPVFLQFWYPFFANSGTRFSQKWYPFPALCWVFSEYIGHPRKTNKNGYQFWGKTGTKICEKRVPNSEKNGYQISRKTGTKFGMVNVTKFGWIRQAISRPSWIEFEPLGGLSSHSCPSGQEDGVETTS